jgi:hypothetical protein
MFILSICTEELPFNNTNLSDVWLDTRVTVPTIELQVASLVNLNAGVSVNILAVQLTILGKENSY